MMSCFRRQEKRLLFNRKCFGTFCVQVTKIVPVMAAKLFTPDAGRHVSSQGDIKVRLRSAFASSENPDDGG